MLKDSQAKRIAELEELLSKFNYDVKNFPTFEEELRYAGRKFSGTHLGGLLQGAAIHIEGLKSQNCSQMYAKSGEQKPVEHGLCSRNGHDPCSETEVGPTCDRCGDEIMSSCTTLCHQCNQD